MQKDAGLECYGCRMERVGKPVGQETIRQASIREVTADGWIFGGVGIPLCPDCTQHFSDHRTYERS